MTTALQALSAPFGIMAPSCINPNWVITAVVDFHIMAITPIVAAVGCGLYYLVRAPFIEDADRDQLKAVCLSTFGFLYFLFYPSITVAAARVLALCESICSEAEGDCTEYMRADYSVECGTSAFGVSKAFAGVAFALYALIGPLLVAVPAIRELYARQRDSTTSNDAVTTPGLNEGDSFLLPGVYSFYQPFRPALAYWETEDMLRKLLVTGIVVFLVAAWGQGKCYFLCNDRETVHEHVEINKSRRRFIKEKTSHMKLKLFRGYSNEMDAVDGEGKGVLRPRMMIQSENWAHYPREFLLSHAKSASHSVHVMLIEAYQRQFKEPVQPLSKAEFNLRLRMAMMKFNGGDAGHYECLGIRPFGYSSPKPTEAQPRRTSPRKHPKRVQNSASAGKSIGLARYDQVARHTLAPLPGGSNKKTCRACGKKSAAHYCKGCGAVLHCPSASRGVCNTNGADWPCAAMCHDCERDAAKNGALYQDYKGKLGQFELPKEVTECLAACSHRRGGNKTKKRFTHTSK